MYFTSGTTGNPKAVEHNFAHPLGHIITAKYWQQVQENKLHMIGHGLFHLRADVLVVHRHDGLHVGAIGAVDHILARELQRRGDDGGAQRIMF